MQLKNTLSTSLTQTARSASNAVAPLTQATILVPDTPPKTPVDSVTPSVAAPAAAAPSLDAQHFTIKPSNSATLASQGIFQVIHTPKTNGHVVTTEIFELSKAATGADLDSTEITGEHKIVTETCERFTLKLKDLPAWAQGLKSLPQLPTVRGVEDALSNGPSALTTPVRCGSVDNVTTPADSLIRLNTSPPADSIGFSASARELSKDSDPGPASHSAISIAMTNKSRVRGTKVSTNAKASTTNAAQNGAKTFPLGHAKGSLLFDNLGVPAPVLPGYLKPNSHRLATIDYLFDAAPDAPVALAVASEATPFTAVPSPDPIKVTPSKNRNGFAPFTPGTTKLIDDCEALSAEVFALPSLTPMFQANYKPSKCETKAITAMQANNSSPPHASGSSASVLSAPTPRPQRKKNHNRKRMFSPEPTGPPKPKLKKRMIVDLSSDDEIEIIDPKGKGKSPASAKKPKVD